MNLALVIFIGACTLVISAQAFPFLRKETQPGIPTSLLEEEQQQFTQDGQQLSPFSPLTREKRHKKVVVIHQYYGQPGYGGYPCRGVGCNGGYYERYTGPYDYYPGSYNSGYDRFGKFKKYIG